MKKSEAMDLYEGLNEISPKMIEEAGNYKKTASVDIRYKKSNNVKKIIAAGIVAAAAVTDRKSTRLNSSHKHRSRMPSSA